MTEKTNVLYLFDVDGTLTKSRQVMLPEMAAVLSALKKRVHVGIVSGSNIPKVVEQIAGRSGTLEDIADFDFIFAENGLDAYRRGQKLATQNIIKHCGEDLVQDLLNFGLRYMSDLKLPKKRGTFVEFRNGMINFSPIGRSCSQAERDEFVVFDDQNGVRAKFVEALRQKFPDDAGLDFSIGGQISIDIYPRGWNKTYCLRFLEDENFDEIHFFGDRVTEGGNDYEIYVDPRTIGHAVTDPQDTASQLMDLIPELRDDVESSK